MLKQRIVTALLMALPVLAMLLWAPPSSTIVLFTLVLLLGAWEWSSFLGVTQAVARAAYVVLIGIAIAGCWFYLLPRVSLEHLLLVVLAWWLLALMWIAGRPEFVSGLLAGIAGVLVLAPAWLSLALLQLRLVHGPQWVLFLFLLVVSADIGGFFFGRKFGRTKLAPRVSPGKTWEGAVGGLVLATLVAGAGAYWFAVPVITFVLLCVATVIMSVVGDLTESLFKRHAGLKDSSTLLPGHGGVLDRIDSVTAAAPVFLYGLIYLGVFPL
jgi:phosphatidate cytidylyltransferase